MRLPNTRHILPLLLLAVMLLAVACSTQKNTAKSRWWHSFNARYNTYYNGAMAYIDGSLEKENGNKDNFTEIIPLYTVGNKQSRELGKANFDRAVEKCEKAIKLHSIKRRPVWDKKRRKTARDIEWLNRREYNPFLWKAWLLMGRAQFHEGAFDEAASTFSYMSRLYRTQPAIYGRARAWLAKSYIEEGWMYDAEDVIRNMRRDSIHWRARKEWDYTMADYYIHTAEYEKAIPYLQKVIKHEMRRKQKAREWYLLGQLYAELGRNELAEKAYRRVTRLSPPYEVEFNARIAMTEVMAAGKSKQMISRLKRMAASDNNKDYLDQVYYAMGNIYLHDRDTVRAIAAYEQGNKKATRSGIEKGVLLLKLGDLYWAKEKFADAQRCYGEAIGLLDKERKDYQQLSDRSKVLDELVPYTEAVHLQDSLQELAHMSEKDRNAAIDRVIDALKKKEKEEKNAQAEQEAQQVQQQNGGNQTRRQTTQPVTNQNNAQWYFYNPTAVSQGKSIFLRQWGKRENVDDWQRVNKTVVATNNLEEMTDSMRDSLMQAAAMEDSLKQVSDSAQNDPHRREYYLAQIPFTEEQVAASNDIIMDGLYHSGVIFKDKLDNLRLSEKALRRLTDEYPNYQNMADAYYHLFLLYSRQNMPAEADVYLQKLKTEYPDNQWTAILTDPYFRENAQMGVQIEDSLYAATYDAFKADRYREVAGNTRISSERFPMGANRDKFIFIGGLSKLNDGDADGCLTDMKTVVEKYPESKLAEMAGMIVNGVNAGKRLHGGKFDIGDVWQRRSIVLNDSDSIAARKFSPERNANFVFMLVYKPDSVNENKLLFELAKYNFTSYLVRNFDITVEDADGLHRMVVSGFRNYDEALQYAREFHRQAQLSKLLGNNRAIIISEPNLELLGTQFSYDDYDKFYDKHFAPLKVSTFHLLTEPAEITTRRQEAEEPTPEEIDRLLDDGTFIDNGLDVNPDEGGTVIEENAEDNQQPTGTVIPTEPATTTEPQTQGTVVPTEPQPAGQNAKTEPENVVTEQPANQPEVPSNQSVEPENGTTVVPEVAPEEEGTTIVEEEPAQPAAPTTDTGTTISPEPVGQPSQPAVQQPQTVTQPTPPDRPATTAQPAPSVKPQPAAPAVKDTDDDTIYFDDDSGTTTQPANTGKANNNKKQDNKKESKQSYDLEDEYYDLDGF